MPGPSSRLPLLDQHIPLLAAPSLWLARINLLLALFNMIPGFPLDGGRVLRAAIWWKTANLRRATQVASISGQIVAFGFIAIGIFTAFNGNFFNGITVTQAMQRELPVISPLKPISELIEQSIINGGHRSFLVEEDGEVRGVLTLRDIQTISERKWRLTTAQQVMQPLDKLVKAEPTTELLDALQLMDEAQTSQLTVVDNNQVMGLLSRDSIANYLRLRAELGV